MLLSLTNLHESDEFCVSVRFADWSLQSVKCIETKSELDQVYLLVNCSL